MQYLQTGIVVGSPTSANNDGSVVPEVHYKILLLPETMYHKPHDGAIGDTWRFVRELHARLSDDVQEDHGDPMLSIILRKLDSFQQPGAVAHRKYCMLCLAYHRSLQGAKNGHRWEIGRVLGIALCGNVSRPLGIEYPKALVMTLMNMSVARDARRLQVGKTMLQICEDFTNWLAELEQYKKSFMVLRHNWNPGTVEFYKNQHYTMHENPGNKTFPIKSTEVDQATRRLDPLFTMWKAIELDGSYHDGLFNKLLHFN